MELCTLCSHSCQITFYYMKISVLTADRDRSHLLCREMRCLLVAQHYYCLLFVRTSCLPLLSNFVSRACAILNNEKNNLKENYFGRSMYGTIQKRASIVNKKRHRFLSLSLFLLILISPLRAEFFHVIFLHSFRRSCEMCVNSLRVEIAIYSLVYYVVVALS